MKSMGVKTNKTSRVKSAAHTHGKKRNIQLKFLKSSDIESPTDRIPLNKRSS
tara:strand:+ start:46 stop:201 length:156 start_codon:yes stop_codon:yes gene_type:complete